MPVSWTVEPMAGGLLRLAFAGRGGWDAEAHAVGERMKGAVREALSAHAPSGLILDLREFAYGTGDFLAVAALTALRPLGPGRVCLVADGATAESLSELWRVTHLDRILPVFRNLDEAARSLARPEGGPGAAGPPLAP